MLKDIPEMPDRSSFLSDRVPVCPPDLLALARARSAPRVAIASAGAALPMVSAKAATDAGIMIPIFTGDPAVIRAEAAGLGWDIAGYQLVAAPSEQESAAAAAGLCGTGAAEVLMKGHLHTDIFMKAALARDAGPRTGHRLVHIFHVTHPDGGRPLLISDAAVNVAPNLETRRAELRAVVSMLHKLGNPQPRITILSVTETPIASMPGSIEARELRDWARAEIADARFSGPLALDLALSPAAAAIKGSQNDPVAGFADAIIVPDIVSGNALFKALVYLSGGCAAGLVIGARVPILLTSRADPPAARLASVALAAVAASAP